ncbi:MAG: DDE-type integrase/transposase/recombinase [Campylobacterales bacterium]|nr:DDE-type integrase/transposase/recombinase [Campylobacterales bacterium]
MDNMDEDKKRTAIALFRYALIAPVIQQNVSKQAEYFRGLSEKTHEVPYIGPRRFKFGTLKLWLKQYRRHGFEALKPKSRQDKGESRKITGELAVAIQEAVKQYPFTSCAAIHRRLIAEGHIDIGTVAEGTVRNYIKGNNLKQNNPPEPRKKFEHEHVNDLWIGDCLHGPYIQNGRKKHKVYLIAVIDDHSRMVVGARFFFQENSIFLELVIKEALRTFGVPKAFYCDNGSLFVSSHLQLACARLGIALIHSRPYDSPSRGKIERFFRTVRQKFLSMLTLPDNLDDLNEAFALWLQDEYHYHIHYGINTRPIDRFMDDIKTISVKRPTEEELDRAFEITLYRHVKNDSTVSISGVLYECPTEFIGKKIEIRHPSDKPQELFIYVQDKPVAKLRRLDLLENARPPHLGIRFTEEEQS